jgi:signal transduction histidine kinase
VLGLRRVLAVLGAWALSLGLGAKPARALEYSALEQRTVLRALGPAPDRDLQAEGKRIESIRIVRLPVFDEDDPIPDFVNWFHAQSRELVIRRELVFAEGEEYRAYDIEETIRNLQLISQFGVVVIVPLKSQRPGHVRVVVIVRDVWSLRLNYQLEGTPTNVGSLLINPTEENLFGTRTQLGAVFQLVPDRYSLGGLLAHPRVLGSKVDAYAYVGAHVNLDSGQTEGSFGTFSLYQNLVSLEDKWAFLVGIAWAVEQTRVLDRQRSGVLIDYGWPPSAEIVREPLLSHGIPIEYRTSVLRGGGELARAFGRANKTILTFGLEGNRRKFEATRSANASEQDFAAFVAEELPVSDTRISPFVQLEHKTTRYLATRDVETLELQESFSLGQQAALRVYPAARDLGSSRDLLGTVAWLSYTWPVADGFLRAVGSSHIEHADHARHQATAQAALRYVSPRLSFARVVLDTALVSTYHNYLNRKLVMGGETRPRGYVPLSLRGPSALGSSLELRTFAINVFSARVGAVAFYDLGGVGESVPELRLKQSLGAGVRVLFPQLNRACFRLDWAAPLTAGQSRIPDRPLPGAIYFTFGQAFDLPKLKLPEILGAETTLLELSQ